MSYKGLCISSYKMLEALEKIKYVNMVKVINLLSLQIYYCLRYLYTRNNQGIALYIENGGFFLYICLNLGLKTFL